MNPEHAQKLKLILAILETSTAPHDVDVPGLRMHKLKGSYEGFSAMHVSRNWRVVFGFEGDDVMDVDYVDYH